MDEFENDTKGQADFGFQTVSATEKTRRVGEVFSSVASRYDLMNDLMSFGLHRIWKRLAILAAKIRPSERVLDLAGGTGDLSRKIVERLGDDGSLVLADVNEQMLQHGRDRLLDAGVGSRLSFVQANAEALPFRENYFDVVCIAFGLRNVTDKTAALGEMFRVLRPGGRTFILEFSHLKIPALKRLYDLYSFRVLPKMGALVARDAASYQYLAESIRVHPNQEALTSIMQDVGFERCRYRNLAGGIVALHEGLRV